MNKNCIARVLPMLAGLFLYSNIFAQTYNDFKSSIVRQIPSFKSDWELNPLLNNKEEYILLPMSFNSAIFTHDLKATYFKDKCITDVYLIYTSYKLSEKFNQPKLNEHRLDSLSKLLPNLWKQSWVNWHVIAQNNAKNDNEARKMFHGFIVKVRKSIDTKEELEAMTKILSNDSLGSEECNEVTRVKLKYKMMRTGRFLPFSIDKQKRGITYSTAGFGNRRRPEMKPRADTVLVKEKVCGFKQSDFIDEYLSTIPDRTVYNILERNKDWKDVAVVCDVTGSMYIYSVQLAIWNRTEHFGKIKFFTFFNDGDRKADIQKKIGQTGGIYTIAAISYKKVDSLLFNTMDKGNGGDAAENDLEAVLKAIANFPTVSSIVLIADNNSPVKDISLLPKVTKPVRVILCGSAMGVNTQYLDIARFTKGSVHTVVRDYSGLENVGEREKTIIDGREYMLYQGKFIPSID